MKSKKSIFQRIRQKLFEELIDWEIFNRIFPHTNQEKNYEYPFCTDEQMNLQTEHFEVRALLHRIERQTCEMPKAYGESFRHIMHRDLHERLKMYEEVAHHNVNPKNIDARFVATQAS